MSVDRPNPQTIRDLRLMYETCGCYNGCIEYKSLNDAKNSSEYKNGDIISMSLNVVPSEYEDKVVVGVYRKMVTNKTDDKSYYTPKALVDWEMSYTFDEFKVSPFYDMCIDRWSDRNGVSWDTSKMDEHEAWDDDTRWYVYAHVYEHEYDWLHNWRKTGNISSVNFELNENGNTRLYLDGDCFWDGDIWSLVDAIQEHEDLKKRLSKLKEHGIDLDDGTLSIRLWEE